MGPITGCRRCGWSVHSSKAKNCNFCPQCGGAAVSQVADLREIDPTGQCARDWAEYQRLKAIFEQAPKS